MADDADRNPQNLAEAQATIDGMRETLALQERALAATELELETKASDPAVANGRGRAPPRGLEKWRRTVRENRAAIAALQETTDKLAAVWGKPPTVN